MRREPEAASFVIPVEWHNRLRLVDDDLKATLLGAEYWFPVSVGNLVDADDSPGFVGTGLKCE